VVGVASRVHIIRLHSINNYYCTCATYSFLLFRLFDGDKWCTKTAFLFFSKGRLAIIS